MARPAPASFAALITARRSTLVTPAGTQIKAVGAKRNGNLVEQVFLMMCSIIFKVVV